MLRKLMKHELRATGRIMLPMFLLVLITAVGANISTRTLLEMDSGVLNVLGLIIMTAFALAIAAVCIMAFVLMIQRFYKNLLQDEGYVMMTLPVSVHQHVISKLLVSMLWFVLSAVVVAAAFFILAYEVGIVTDIFTGLKKLLTEMGAAEYYFDAAAFVVEFTVLLFFGCAASCLNIYLAMAIGHSFANRKLLMSVVAYFVIQFALEIVAAVFASILSRLSDSGALLQLEKLMLNMAELTVMHVALLCVTLMSIISAAVFYFPTVWCLKHKLNLE